MDHAATGKRQAMVEGRGARVTPQGLYTILVAGILTLGVVNAAWAHKAPPNCSKTGPSLLLGEFFDTDGDGVGETPVNRAKMDGERVYYQATLTFTVQPPTQCAYFGGNICIDPPGSTGCTDVTPTGGIPTICQTVDPVNNP